MIDLSPSAMYGHWDHLDPMICEFQHGNTMIYISYDSTRSMKSRLANIQKNIDADFNNISEVLCYAKRISENSNPEFWKRANQIKLKQNPLIVFSLRYQLDFDGVIYDISWNPVFKPESGTILDEYYLEEELIIDSLPKDRKWIKVGKHINGRLNEIA